MATKESALIQPLARYMQKLGFCAQWHQNSVYFNDGHEQEDKVLSSVKFLDDVAQFMCAYFKKNMMKTIARYPSNSTQKF